MATSWFYYKQDVKLGPLRSRDLLALAQDGTLLESDLVWKEGWTEPKPASLIQGLFSRSSPPRATKKVASKTTFREVDALPRNQRTDGEGTIRIPPPLPIPPVPTRGNSGSLGPNGKGDNYQLPETVPGKLTREMARRKEQAKDAFNLYRLFWSRILKGDFSLIHSTPPEVRLLNQGAGGVTSPLAQDYACWRRSLLMVCALVLGVSLVFAGYDAVTGAMNSLRHPVIRLQGFSLFLFQSVSFVLCILAAKNWFSIRLSRGYARMAWIVQFAGPFLVFFAPLSLFVSDQLVLFSLGLTSIVTLAPKIFGLFPGLIRCSLTIKTLLPEAAAPGWLGIVIAPIFFLMLFVAAIAALQTGFIILGIGFICLGIGSLGVLICAKNLLVPSTQQDASRIVGKVKKFQVTFQIAGLGLVLWQILKVSGVTFDLVSDLFLFAFSYLGNVTLLTVAMSDFMLGMIREGQKQAEGFFNSDMAGLYQERLDQLAACGLTDFDAGESMLAGRIMTASSNIRKRVAGNDPGNDSRLHRGEPDDEIMDFA